VAGCRKRKITPHVAQKPKGSAIDKRTTRHPGYRVSLKIRKRIEEGFGWLKTTAGMRKTKLIGREKLSAQLLLGFSVYNLIRIGSLSGWWRGAHVVGVLRPQYAERRWQSGKSRANGRNQGHFSLISHQAAPKMSSQPG
jgi:hypothetical protein